MVPRPFISFLPFCLYTKFLAFPPSHFCVCVCTREERLLCRDQLHLLPEQNKKKAGSTYSFLKYLTNSLMTTCTVYCWRIRYNILLKFGFFSPTCAQPTCLHIVCVLSSSSSSWGLWTRWLKGGCWNSQKNQRMAARAVLSALLCWSITVINTPVESKRLVDRHKRDWKALFLFGFALLFFLRFFYRPVRFGWPDFREITPANQSMVKGFFFKSKWTGGHTHTHTESIQQSEWSLVYNLYSPILLQGSLF